jgi:precorrin-6A/cobalt-precorrin-6A reductase
MPKAGERRHVLILGGTTEAYALATALAERDDCRVTTSLAGVTTEPRLPAGVVRIGGFGGSGGLADWLAAASVALVVDASHPFASRITRNARDAAAAVGCRYLRLERPPWQPGPGDRWHRVADLDAALATLERLGARRVFAALGARAVPALAAASAEFVVRGIEPPAALPANVSWLAGRGPFAVEAERRLLVEQRIDALLCRDSGGAGARAKLDAARSLALPVVLLARPAAAGGETVSDVAAAVAVVDRMRCQPAGAVPR